MNQTTIFGLILTVIFVIGLLSFVILALKAQKPLKIYIEKEEKEEE